MAAKSGGEVVASAAVADVSSPCSWVLTLPSAVTAAATSAEAGPAAAIAASRSENAFAMSVWSCAMVVWIAATAASSAVVMVMIFPWLESDGVEPARPLLMVVERVSRIHAARPNRTRRCHQGPGPSAHSAWPPASG